MKSIAPVYRYYLADLKTGAFVMEVPFSSVSWSRKVSAAGSFSGTISADPLQDNYDLYDTTMPGRYGLYVVRDGVCLWGGIIWGREYDITSKVLKVDGLEMSSYLYHRTFWKTMTIPSGISIKTMLETFMENVFNDQKDIDDRIGYSASDLHNQITNYEHRDTYTVEVTTKEDHGYNNNETVYIGGFKTSVTNGGQDFYNGETNIEATQGVETSAGIVNIAPNRFSFTVSGEGDTGGAPVGVGAGAAPYSTILSQQNTVQGAAELNIDIDIDDDLKVWITSTYGDNDPFTFNGSEGTYVGEILENFASRGIPCYFATDPTKAETSKRFDFYIESSFDPFTRTFSNVFKAWLVQKDNNDPTSASEVAVDLSSLYGPSKVPATNYIFEHPGNIISLTLTENASESATRTWMVDNNNDLGEIAQKYYASYTNLSYLEKGWPLLDKLITDRDLSVSNDQQVFSHAFAAGYKLAPPIGAYSISVNGSFDPEVGTYKPGDWCIVVPGDEFIKARLKPPYENRENILVRKIASFDVSVPDNPTFPETVKLDLVAEWEVSKENLTTVSGGAPTTLLDMTITGDISSPFPELYDYNGIDPVTPISLSVTLRSSEGVNELAEANILLSAKEAALNAFSVVNSADYRAANTALTNANNDLAKKRTAFNTVKGKGYKKTSKQYKDAKEAVDLAVKVVAAKLAARDAITVQSTEEYQALAAAVTDAKTRRDGIEKASRIPSNPVVFQRYYPVEGWVDLPFGTVLTNANSVAVYNYIINTASTPESLKEPQNRLAITNADPFPQTKFRAVYPGQGGYGASESSEAGIYIRTKYEFTYVPRYNNAPLIANDYGKIATTPLSAAQVATTFKIPNLTDKVISSAVINTNIATITTSTEHPFRVGDLVTLYNLTSGSGYVEYTVLSVPEETTTRLTDAQVRSFTVAYTGSDGALTLGTDPVARFTAYPAIGAAIGPAVTEVSLAVAGWQDEKARLRAGVWANDGELVAFSGNTDVAPKISGYQYIDLQPFPMTHSEEESLITFDTEYLIGFKRNTASNFSTQWALDTTAYPLGFPAGISTPNVFYDNRTASGDIEPFDKDQNLTNTSLIYVVKYEFTA